MASLTLDGSHNDDAPIMTADGNETIQALNEQWKQRLKGAKTWVANRIRELALQEENGARPNCTMSVSKTCNRLRCPDNPCKKRNLNVTPPNSARRVRQVGPDLEDDFDIFTSS
ncbi:hypothetical protein BDZ89DRAFT_1139228 [Hymenopellis radicata]|nr:hypothetical protein BDZ89DRAFT_1139228 [Hymenopellis radicata]